MPVTFQVAKIEPEQCRHVGDSTSTWDERTVMADAVDVPHTEETLKVWTCGEGPAGASGEKYARSPIRYNGMIGAALEAWKGHHNLSLSPDHVWIAIMQSFCRYMNEGEGADKLRGHFVHHEAGKMKLSVQVGAQDLEEIDWAGVARDFSSQIDDNTKPGVVDWVQANFSTTGERERLVSRAQLMCTLQQYFEYEVECVCGIPSVTVEGAVEDWQEIARRIKKLKDYGLKEWYLKLKPIIAQFIAVFSEKVDKKFWSQICIEDVVYHESSGEGDFFYGGGGPTSVTYLSGWVTVFYPSVGYRGQLHFPPGLGYGKIDINDVPSSICECDIVLKTAGDESPRTVNFLCGFFGISIVGEDSKTIRPVLNWGIGERRCQMVSAISAFERLLRLKKEKVEESEESEEDDLDF